MILQSGDPYNDIPLLPIPLGETTTRMAMDMTHRIRLPLVASSMPVVQII